jgi:hypothetical protein
VTLYDIDILVFGESVHFEPGKLLQSIPEDWIGRPRSHTTYCISSVTVYRVGVVQRLTGIEEKVVSLRKSRWS